MSNQLFKVTRMQFSATKHQKRAASNFENIALQRRKACKISQAFVFDNLERELAVGVRLKIYLLHTHENYLPFNHHKYVSRNYFLKFIFDHLLLAILYCIRSQ